MEDINLIKKIKTEENINFLYIPRSNTSLIFSRFYILLNSKILNKIYSNCYI